MATVTLITCANAIKAEILKSALEGSGIPCILQGVTSSQVNGISAIDVPVLVREEDLEEARQVIAESLSEA